MSYQNFKQIIQQEWEKEFPESDFSISIFYNSYEELINRICTQVWNSAIQTAADNADADFEILSEDAQHDFQRLQAGEDYEVYALKESILKFKL